MCLFSILPAKNCIMIDYSSEKNRAHGTHTLRENTDNSSQSRFFLPFFPDGTIILKKTAGINTVGKPKFTAGNRNVGANLVFARTFPFFLCLLQTHFFPVKEILTRLVGFHFNGERAVAVVVYNDVLFDHRLDARRRFGWNYFGLF